MKKVFLLLAALVSMNAFALEPGDDNGFGIRLGLELPGSGYGTPKIDGIDSPDMSSIGFGVALDNRWYVWHNDMFGAAINARWIDFSYAKGSFETEYVGSSKKTFTTDVKSISVDICSPGAMFTYYPADNMAVDLSYNIAPSVLMTTDSMDGEDESTSVAFGASHIIGAGFRYSVFHGGVEYKLGKLGVLSADDETLEAFDLQTNKVRVYLGFKF